LAWDWLEHLFAVVAAKELTARVVGNYSKGQVVQMDDLVFFMA